MTTFMGFSLIFEIWYAADMPVIPDPIIHRSASLMRGPSLPSFAKGLTSLEGCNQNECVELETGNEAGSPALILLNSA